MGVSTHWAEHGSLDRRDDRKKNSLGFLLKNQSNTIVLFTSHYFWKEKKKICGEFMVCTPDLLYFTSVKHTVSGLNESLYVRADSLFRKGPRRDRASAGVQPPADRAPSSDAVHRCCRPWNSEVRQHPATQLASRDHCRCYPQRLFHSQGEIAYRIASSNASSFWICPGIHSSVLFCREPISSLYWPQFWETSHSGRNQTCFTLSTSLMPMGNLWREMLSCLFQQVLSLLHLHRTHSKDASVHFLLHFSMPLLKSHKKCQLGQDFINVTTRSCHRKPQILCKIKGQKGLAIWGFPRVWHSPEFTHLQHLPNHRISILLLLLWHFSCFAGSVIALSIFFVCVFNSVCSLNKIFFCVIPSSCHTIPYTIIFLFSFFMKLSVPWSSFPELILDVLAESTARECQVWAIPVGLISHHNHTTALPFPLSVTQGC